MAYIADCAGCTSQLIWGLTGSGGSQWGHDPANLEALRTNWHRPQPINVRVRKEPRDRDPAP